VAQEPEDSSPHSQQPATGPWPEPVESNPHPQPISLRPILIASSHQRLGLPSGLFPSGFATKTLFVHFSLLSHSWHMPCPPHPPWLDLPDDIWRWVQIMKILIVQLPPFSRHLKYSSQTPFSNILSLCSSLSVRDQVSHSYKATDRIMVLCPLTFTFLDSILVSVIRLN
jgi:hypothetical protein